MLVIIKKHTVAGLCSMAFPTLWPTGKGDPTSVGRMCTVSLSDAFRYLMYYGEPDSDGLPHYRFVAHPRFVFWACDMMMRHHANSQARYFMNRIPGVKELSVAFSDGPFVVFVHSSFV